MTSRRDLVNADDYARRRMLAAFSSGSNGDLEDVPRRPNRFLWAGLAVVLFIAATVGVRTYLHHLPPRNWLSDGSLVVDGSTGARYVARDKVLVPVPNLVSAALLGSLHKDPITVRPEVLRTARQGSPTGVPAAPDAVPRVGRTPLLVCATGAGSLAMQVGRSPAPTQVAGNPSAVLVSSPGQGLWLVLDGKRYRMTAASRAALGYSTSPVARAPKAWIDLVPVAADMSVRTPPGQLRKDDLTGDLFLEQGGQLRPVASETVGLLIADPVTPIPHAGVASASIGPTYDMPGVPRGLPTVPPGGSRAVPCLDSSGATEVVGALDTSGQESTTYTVDDEGTLRVVSWADSGVGALLGTPTDDPDDQPDSIDADLVVGGVRYRFEDTSALSALGYADDDALRVGKAWLGLFTAGPGLPRYDEKRLAAITGRSRAGALG